MHPLLLSSWIDWNSTRVNYHHNASNNLKVISITLREVYSNILTWCSSSNELVITGTISRAAFSSAPSSATTTSSLVQVNTALHNTTWTSTDNLVLSYLSTMFLWLRTTVDSMSTGWYRNPLIFMASSRDPTTYRESKYATIHTHNALLYNTTEYSAYIHQELSCRISWWSQGSQFWHKWWKDRRQLWFENDQLTTDHCYLQDHNILSHCVDYWPKSAKLIVHIKSLESVQTL